MYIQSNFNYIVIHTVNPSILSKRLDDINSTIEGILTNHFTCNKDEKGINCGHCETHILCVQDGKKYYPTITTLPTDEGDCDYINTTLHESYMIGKLHFDFCSSDIFIKCSDIGMMLPILRVLFEEKHFEPFHEGNLITMIFVKDILILEFLCC
jgi:hypothetical protein